MCGIAGIWNLNSRSLELNTLKKFTNSIAHRGPDGSGYELLNNNTLGFGHRRLSILDLSDAGKQPMFNESRDLVISFNGEIYNFIEIRKELIASGEKFITETDTEVILKAYKRWGKDCLNKFNGMFAIAIWDENKKELLLIRDRFGVKPMYYLFIPNLILAFASETVAFKNLSGFNREVDQKVLDIALVQPDIIEGSDKTIFKHIYQLLPGHLLTLKEKELPLVKRWWNTKDNLVKPASSYENQVEEFRDLFEDACKLRMRSDVTIASALSGGLDSSSVYCTLHKLNNSKENIERLPSDWQRAFVATFPNTKVDERIYAEQVVEHVNGKATYIVPDYKNLVNDIISATKLFDGIIQTPITSISDVYKSMRQNGVTVSLDGHAVDEMMYGYNSYVLEAFYDSIQKKEFDKAKEYAAIISGLSPAYNYEQLLKKIRQFDRSIVEKGISFVKNKLSTKKNSETVNGTSPKWFNDADTTIYNEITSQFNAPAGMSKPEQKMYTDFHYRSLPINLRDFDRASMQHGIEIRMPFMDYRLVSYVFSLPQDSKLGGGFTKRILRDAMKNTLPENIRTRTFKIGIGAPMEEWFSNELRTYILDTTASGRFKDSSYWNGNEIKKDIDKAYNENKLDKVFCNKAWAVLNADIILNG
jgi:asparagine synthase (glutamine-hydrolysing)